MQLPTRIISPDKTIQLVRRLPAAGEVLVQRGQQVAPLQPVARTALPRQRQMIFAPPALVPLADRLAKPVGAQVEKDEVLAEVRGRLPFSRHTLVSPGRGRIAAAGTDWILLDLEPTPVELPALAYGVVSRVLPGEGVVLQVRGAVVGAACGFGGEAFGVLKRLANNPFDTPEPDEVTERFTHAIIIAGRTIDEATLRAAERVRARGVIVGSFDARLQQARPRFKIPVVATEGYGEMAMSPQVFSLLMSLTGREVAIWGTAPRPYGGLPAPVPAQPPMILMSVPGAGTPPEEDPTVAVGSTVRICRGDLHGMVGTVTAIPPEPQSTAAGVSALGAVVKLNNETIFVPWGNLEKVG